MTNIFKDLKPHIGEISKTEPFKASKDVDNKERKSMISEMVGIIRENKRIMEEEMRTSANKDEAIFG